MLGPSVILPRADIEPDLMDFFEPAECGRCYVCNIVEVFREVKRVLRDDGTLWLVIGDSYAGSWGNQGRKDGRGTQREINGPMLQNFAAGYPINGSNTGTIRDAGLKPKDLIGIPWRVAFALQADGWYLRSDIIWSKPNPMPESVRDRPTKSHEYIFLLSKQPRYFFDAEAVKEANAVNPNWNYGSENYRQGVTQDAYKVDGDNKTRQSAGRGWKGLAPAGPNGAGRNIRSVWTIATHPYAEAHFATFPPDLAERCIKAGTSEKGACGACGAPYVRVVEREGETARDRATRVGFVGYAEANGSNPQGLNHAGHRGDRTRTSQTTGWRPSCQCSAGVTPCVVLDPFSGAGTVSLVAERLGRDSIGVELNPSYVEMAEKRIRADCPMFATVETN